MTNYTQFSTLTYHHLELQMIILNHLGDLLAFLATIYKLLPTNKNSLAHSLAPKLAINVQTKQHNQRFLSNQKCAKVTTIWFGLIWKQTFFLYFDTFFPAKSSRSRWLICMISKTSLGARTFCMPLGISYYVNDYDQTHLKPPTVQQTLPEPPKSSLSQRNFLLFLD